MTRYTDNLNAENLIKYIANDLVELSQDKVLLRYHEHIQMCRDWLKYNSTNETDEDVSTVLPDDF
jgi:hypothetical protein